jgi:hypothetical protein
MKRIKRLAMKKVNLVILLLASFAVTARAQTPQLLIHASQCLVAKHNFSVPMSTALTFGYTIDEKSYPGERVMYVVNYAPPTQSDGSVFVIFLTQHGGHQVFNIQNNAGFVLTKNATDGISFTNPPLGGTWTQEHLESSIKEIEKQSRFTIPAKDFLAVDSSIRCESYTDPRR